MSRAGQKTEFDEGAEHHTRGAYAPRNSQIIPNHDDFVEECLKPATAGKLTTPPCPSVQILRPDFIHRKPLTIDDKLQDLGELVGRADS
jgi:hypothetical protein